MEGLEIFCEDLQDNILGGSSLSNVIDDVSKFVNSKIKTSEKKARICNEIRTKEGVEMMKRKELKHHYDTTIGLWCTDRPDLIKDPKKVMFQLTTK